jgi:GDP-L-fucose synthase
VRIFVTGASGYLGRALCARLHAAGHVVTGIASQDCDLTRQESLDRFSSAPYDRIYHLAAWTQAGDFCLLHPGEQWIRNQQLNTNVLKWWQERQPHAELISIGTSCAYEPGCDMAESSYLRGLPIDSLLSYAMTKRMLYSGLVALNKQFGLRYLYVIPSTLYGPGYDLGGRQRHFIFDIIHKIIKGKECGEPVILWGDGSQKRELVFLSDFVDILLQLSDHIANDIVNIGAGEEHSIRYYAELVCDVVRFPKDKIQYDLSRYVGATSKCLNVGKLQSLVTDYRMTDLRRGIEDTVAWCYKTMEVQ